MNCKKSGLPLYAGDTVAKRARQLLDNPEELGDRKPVSVAVEELDKNLLKVDFPEDYHK